jgi:4-alpha-glucanotransferase
VSDKNLASLAREAGLSVHWTDAFGAKRSVSPETLRAVLSSLGYPATCAAGIRESRGRVRAESGARSRKESAGQTAFFPKGNHAKAWGVAVQLYSLRGGHTKGYGDFAALAEFIGDAAQYRADAVAISPVHARVPGRDAHYSPYSPSTRLFLDPLFAPVPSGTPALDRTRLIDWKSASAAKHRALDAAYRKFQNDARERDAFERFVNAGGTRLLDHARFEALHMRLSQDSGNDWRKWPAAFRSPRSEAVNTLQAIDPEVERHLYFQWLADRGLADAQAAAKKAGMSIGIIADLAVGMDPCGSHAWSAPDEVLLGVSIGAPPDLLARYGQNWGLTALSPLGLRTGNFAGFVTTLRANMRHAGGIRVDHAMGMQRLWLIPDGAQATEGVYLSYPFEELLALTVRESRRAKTFVIAEDLGTVPIGFRAALSRAGILGMRVLPFERERDGTFRGCRRWDREACALTATHDLATLAGWWSGRDIDWQAKLRADFPEARVRRERNAERKLLWCAFRRSRKALGKLPGTARVQDEVDAAIAFVAQTPSKIALFPVEDIAGLIEQPNIPGTVDEHPNWRRRLPVGNGLKTARARKRLTLIAKERA